MHLKSRTEEVKLIKSLLMQNSKILFWKQDELWENWHSERLLLYIHYKQDKRKVAENTKRIFKLTVRWQFINVIHDCKKRRRNKKRQNKKSNDLVAHKTNTGVDSWKVCLDRQIIKRRWDPYINTTMFYIVL